MVFLETRPAKCRPAWVLTQPPGDDERPITPLTPPRGAIQVP